MFSHGTLFIVGAGASKEVGIPTGPELKTVIANKLNLQYNWHELTAGDPVLDQALRQQIRISGESSIHAYQEAAWKIRDALPQALSIDNFIDAYNTDQRIALCGKLAIAQSILEAENSSSLKLPRGYERTRGNQGPNLSLVQGTWLNKFFKLLSENIRKDSVQTVFDNVSFIIFNYDRCVEHYLFHALQNYYTVSETDAAALVGKLTILHPYERVSPLPWQDQAQGTAFGGLDQRASLLDIASKIRTFTESETTPTLLQSIRAQVKAAKTIVFLGFAFHELNMELLTPGGSCQAERVFATALKMSDSDAYVVGDDIINMLGSPPTLRQIEIKTNLRCSQLLDEYWRSLSR